MLVVTRLDRLARSTRDLLNTRRSEAVKRITANKETLGEICTLLQCEPMDDCEVGDMTTAQHIYDYDVFDSVTERWPKAGDKLLSPGRDTFLAEGYAERNYASFEFRVG